MKSLEFFIKSSQNIGKVYQNLVVLLTVLSAMNAPKIKSFEAKQMGKVYPRFLEKFG